MTSKTAAPSWKKQARTWHKVTPPSGMTGVELRIPSLTELIRDQAVPDRLRAIALKAAAHPAGMRGVMADQLAKDKDKADAEVIDDGADLRQAIDDLAEMQKRLVTSAVRVDGDLLTLEDIEDPEFPQPDLEFYGGVMLREIDYDARGVRLGIEPLDAFGSFRRFHDCGPDCSACAALQDEFSSVDLGAL